MDLYIGINGGSLQKEETIEALQDIRLDRLIVETDSPYHDINMHYACSKFIKTKFPEIEPKHHRKDMLVIGRNEPCKIVWIIEALSAILKINEATLCQIIWKNTLKMFNIIE